MKYTINKYKIYKAWQSVRPTQDSQPDFKKSTRFYTFVAFFYISAWVLLKFGLPLTHLDSLSFEIMIFWTKKKKRWRKLLFLILKGLAVPIWLIFPWLFLVRRSFWLTTTSHWSFEESNQHLSYLLIVGLVFIYPAFRLLVGH